MASPESGLPRYYDEEQRKKIDDLEAQKNAAAERDDAGKKAYFRAHERLARLADRSDLSMSMKVLKDAYEEAIAAEDYKKAKSLQLKMHDVRDAMEVTPPLSKNGVNEEGRLANHTLAPESIEGAPFLLGSDEDDPLIQAQKQLHEQKLHAFYEERIAIESLSLNNYLEEVDGYEIFDHNIDPEYRYGSVESTRKLFDKWMVEVDEALSLSQEMVRLIWEPYRIAFNMDTKEFNSVYEEERGRRMSEADGEVFYANRERMTGTAQRVLTYWQEVLDNARFIKDILNDRLSNLPDR